MYESNPRVPIPPWQPLGIWHDLSPGWEWIWHLFRSRYPGHLTPWKKRRNTLCIPIICININRDSLICKGLFSIARRIVDVTNVRAKHYWIDIRTNSTRCLKKIHYWRAYHRKQEAPSFHAHVHVLQALKYSYILIIDSSVTRIPR